MKVLLTHKYVPPFGRSETYIIATDATFTMVALKDERLTDLRRALTKIFSNAIDIDEWKHSWHTDVEKYDTIEIRDKIRDVVKKAIEKRQSELDFLNKVEIILMSQIINNNIVESAVSDAIEDLPF